MPAPVVFEPILKHRPWGGASLARWGKALPAGAPIGESWELSDLPGDESPVARGPLAGRTIRELMALWGRELLGNCASVGGRFPLLVKLLDAAENLSVQVHPRPRTAADAVPPGQVGAAAPAVKHECWVVLEAQPGAVLYAGLRPHVRREDLAAALGTPGMVDLLVRREVRVGDCLYLPSGTLHALGAGILVAEVQTPSDVTYRAYDWERRDAEGRPRTLHLAETLENVRWDVAESHIVTPASAPDLQTARFAPIEGATPLVRCPAFALDRWTGRIGGGLRLGGQMAVLIGLSGRLWAKSMTERVAMDRGETMLIPAVCARHMLRADMGHAEGHSGGQGPPIGADVLIVRASSA